MDTVTVHDLLHAIDKLDALISAVEFIETEEMETFLTILYGQRETIQWKVREEYGFILEKDYLFED